MKRTLNSTGGTAVAQTPERDHKQDFPLLLSRLENGRQLTYLDNAATTQKPAAVIEAVSAYYRTHNANPHRGAYALSAEATDCYEGARAAVKTFIGAGQAEEIVFTRGTTEALNLVATSYGLQNLKTGDEILLSVAEHHSNLLPWQRAARLTGAVLRYVYPDKDGELSPEEITAALTEKTKIVALAHVSNVLGAVNPIAEITRLAHAKGAVVVVDGAQSVPHIPVDVQALDVDFMAFSAHKMYGPAGFGVLYGKKPLLDGMEPLLLGGGIVEQVTKESATLLETPSKFEAGTPNVEGAVGLQAAIQYINSVGFAAIEARESLLTAYMLEQLSSLEEVEVYGSPHNKTGIAAFNVKGVHPHDVASILDAAGVTIRAGHHCAQPLMQHLGVNACCRASLALYNTTGDIDRFIEALKGVRGWLGL